MAQRTVIELADVAADILQDERRHFAESQAKLQADFEALAARFDADLEKLAPKWPKEEAKVTLAEESAYNGLARRCWDWLHRNIGRWRDRERP